ncbi:hypothetical protein IC235_06765 [Hymenobacter sp. BT664]|uniref:STAS/SEC14 domain-containing protein n=1 Tax=Hymenobacter montanus TaxID=2771359 RepID=A0A927GIZ5_9BACT|nr:hypothetical protein [Hymenobacter montanus]MBD2767591.1 hypothetical protein [Hymenobacter montanus]
MNLLLRTKEALYFQSPAGKIFHHPAGFVRLTWSAERTSIETVKAFYEQALALLIHSGARKILSDHGQRQPLSGVAQQWLIENWMPRLISQVHACHCALVEGTNALHRLAVQSVLNSSPSGLVFQRFATVEAAEAWLSGIRT